MQHRRFRLATSCGVALGLLLGGCHHDAPPTPPTHAVEHHHEHQAPHGGTLVAFGEEFAHLELVLDGATGTLTAYALDGEAEKAVPLTEKQIELDLSLPQPVHLVLAAVASPLTGETVGHTSQFEAQDPALKGATTFGGTVKPLTIKGAAQPATAFRFPEGNENPEEHHHDG